MNTHTYSCLYYVHNNENWPTQFEFNSLCETDKLFVSVFCENSYIFMHAFSKLMHIKIINSESSVLFVFHLR